jgi:hypothetical protein
MGLGVLRMASKALGLYHNLDKTTQSRGAYGGWDPESSIPQGLSTIVRGKLSCSDITLIKVGLTQITQHIS